MLHNFGPHAFGESRRHLLSCIALEIDVYDGGVYKNVLMVLQNKDTPYF